MGGQDEIETLAWCGKLRGLTGDAAMTASQMRIAETIDAFYGDAGAKDGVSRSYKQAVEDLDAETIKALDGPYRYFTATRTARLEVPEANVTRQDNGARTHLSILRLLP